MSKIIVLIIVVFLLPSELFSQITYTWNGSISTAWTNSLNWSPTRATSLASDRLVFDIGGSESVTNVPTETVERITVTNSTALSLTASSTSKTLTINNSTGSDLLIDNGSSLTLVNNAGVVVNITMGAGTVAEIGGTLNIDNGNVNIGANTLLLHTNSAPIAVTSGTVTMSAGGTLEFGNSSNTTGALMTLPNNMFSSAPTIATIVVNRTNGASLGNQAITVTSGVTLTLGDLNTNTNGKLILSTSATDPTETTSSNIVGVLESAPRSVGTGALDLFGFSIAAGADDLGNVTITRTTGVNGVNMFGSNESIASTWEITADNQPVSGRDISLTWESVNDNSNDPLDNIQIYRNPGAGWEKVGNALPLVSQNPRITDVVSTTAFSSWTAADESNALSIALKGLTARQVDDEVLIEWETLTELESDHFEIQRIDGETIVVVGTLKAAGNSTIEQYYYLTDKTPRKGLNYYQLVEIDMQGERTTFRPVSVEFEGDNEKIKIFPKPATNGFLKVFVESDKEESVQIEYFNFSGTMLYQMEGVTNISNTVNTFGYPQGIYFIKVKHNSEVTWHRIIIQ